MRIIRWLSLAAAVAWLNFALTFENVWPTLAIAPSARVSVEIAILVLLVAALGTRHLPGRHASGHAAPAHDAPAHDTPGHDTARHDTAGHDTPAHDTPGHAAPGRPPLGRRSIGVIAAVLTVLALGRYLQVTVAGLYGRPVHLYFDAQHLPNVAAMLAKVAEPIELALGAVLLVAVTALLYATLRKAVARVAAAAAAPAERAVLTIGAGAFAAPFAFLALFAHGSAAPGTVLGERFSEPVTTMLWRQGESWLEAARADARGDLLPPPAELGDAAASAGVDVLVVFVESYGAVAFDRADLAAVLEPGRDRLEQAVARTGRVAVSAFVESPTFAGASWLAHASLLTGSRIDNAGVYARLLEADRDTLAKRFRRAGYRAVALMPGLREAWPEGAFYGFDAVYDAQRLDYRGPEFGWWRIPDQYAIAKLHAIEAGEDAGPRFVFFSTVSTHVPFRPVAPYQRDWSRFAAERPYDSDLLDASLDARPDWFDLAPAYADALEYAYTLWAGYLDARAGEPLVLVLIGDHQPAASITGARARWDVPVHVITDRPGTAAALERAGFTPGLMPGPPEAGPIAPMHALTNMLLDALQSRRQPEITEQRGRR